MSILRSARASGSVVRREGRAAVVLGAAVLLSCGEAPRSVAGFSRSDTSSPKEPVAEELVVRFKAEAVSWIRSERAFYRPRAQPLSDEDRSRFGAYFPHEVLDRARVTSVQGFENPEFFSLFEVYGEPIPLDLRRASGLALVDTILIKKAVAEASRRDRLLFHELVHLMQYEVLGLEEYMDGYVESWAENGRSYRGIPHEDQAFELASRFWGARGSPFSVEAEVRALFGVGPGPTSN